MPTRILARHAHRPRTGLAFLPGLTLVPARVHEFCGPARRLLALIVAKATSGPVFWIGPGWAHDRLHGDGVADLIAPGRITFVSPARTEDLLWSMEETLRAGCVPLVVCECPGIPGLTPVRRLHLAAETAARETGQVPLGLLLIAGAGGAPGAETRWYTAQNHTAIRSCWQIERRRTRMEPPKSWLMTQKGAQFTLEHACPPEV